MVERSGWLTSLCRRTEVSGSKDQNVAGCGPRHAKSIELKVRRTSKTRTYLSLRSSCNASLYAQTSQLLQEALQLMRGVQLT